MNNKISLNSAKLQSGFLSWPSNLVASIRLQTDIHGMVNFEQKQSHSIPDTKPISFENEPFLTNERFKRHQRIVRYNTNIEIEGINVISNNTTQSMQCGQFKLLGFRTEYIRTGSSQSVHSSIRLFFAVLNPNRYIPIMIHNGEKQINLNQFNQSIQWSIIISHEMFGLSYTQWR